MMSVICYYPCAAETSAHIAKPSFDPLEFLYVSCRFCRISPQQSAYRHCRQSVHDVMFSVNFKRNMRNLLTSEYHSEGKSAAVLRNIHCSEIGFFSHAERIESADVFLRQQSQSLCRILFYKHSPRLICKLSERLVHILF